jgi:hypothetical protein
MATSWPIKFHTTAKPGVKRKSDNDAQKKIMKSTNPIGSGYF